MARRRAARRRSTARGGYYDDDGYAPQGPAQAQYYPPAQSYYGPAPGQSEWSMGWIALVVVFAAVAAVAVAYAVKPDLFKKKKEEPKGWWSSGSGADAGGSWTDSLPSIPGFGGQQKKEEDEGWPWWKTLLVVASVIVGVAILVLVALAEAGSRTKLGWGLDEFTKHYAGNYFAAKKAVTNSAVVQKGMEGAQSAAGAVSRYGEQARVAVVKQAGKTMGYVAAKARDYMNGASSETPKGEKGQQGRRLWRFLGRREAGENK